MYIYIYIYISVSLSLHIHMCFASAERLNKVFKVYRVSQFRGLPRVWGFRLYDRRTPMQVGQKRALFQLKVLREQLL